MRTQAHVVMAPVFLLRFMNCTEKINSYQTNTVHCRVYDAIHRFWQKNSLNIEGAL